MVMLQNTSARKYTYSLRGMADFRTKILEHGFDGMLLNMNIVSRMNIIPNILIMKRIFNIITMVHILIKEVFQLMHERLVQSWQLGTLSNGKSLLHVPRRFQQK